MPIRELNSCHDPEKLYYRALADGVILQWELTIGYRRRI